MAEIKELQGEEVKDDRGDWLYIAHVDRELGISISDENDKEQYCLNREQFLARAKLYGCRAPIRFYHEVFSLMLEDLRQGRVRNVQWSYSKSTASCGIYNPFSGTLTCAFH